MPEEKHQGCQGDRVQVAIEVQGHREDVQCLELLENVDEALGVHLAGSGEVVQDVLVGASSGGQLLVSGGQLSNPGKPVFNYRKSEWGHVESRPADGVTTASMVGL